MNAECIMNSRMLFSIMRTISPRMILFKLFCMHKKYLTIGCLLSALAVTLGAFGAHGLNQWVTAESILTFETGVRYQFYHSFALLFTGVIYDKFGSKWIRYAANSFILGIILFSGSLYTLVIFKATDTVGLKSIGIFTPLGGIFFIAGWIFLLTGLRQNSSPVKSL